MSAEPVPSSPVEESCPLCGEGVAPADERCPACGMTLAGVGVRPGPFSHGTLWLWAVILLAVYLAALAIVWSVHD